ncbi:hypothetical protein EPN90_03395, partial [Patescibacteria group bacterium]
MIKKAIKWARYAPFALLALPGAALAQNVNTGINVFQAELGLGTQDIRVTIARIINVAMGLLGI